MPTSPWQRFVCASRSGLHRAPFTPPYGPLLRRPPHAGPPQPPQLRRHTTLGRHSRPRRFSHRHTTAAESRAPIPTREPVEASPPSELCPMLQPPAPSS
jgi:hypothetical protein